MPRPFTRAPARQNAAFLAALARTGNTRLAARELGVHRATYTRRRARDPAFAAQWDTALTAAHARLARGRKGGPINKPVRPDQSSTPVRPGQCPHPVRPEQSRRTSLQASTEGTQFPHKTEGGEPHVTRLRNGRLQLRLAPPGRMTKAAEQAFLRALSSSANVRLSAAAAGFAHSSFYARRRADPDFAREMQAALEIGYDRLECALLERACYNEEDLDAEMAPWRDHIGDNPLPPLNPEQALQLLWHHRRTCRLGWDSRSRENEVASNAEVRRALERRIREMRRGPP